MSTSSPTPLPKSLQFVFGGASGMAATCVVQPIDLVKTRMQLAVPIPPANLKPSFPATLRTIVAIEGVSGLYKGLSAGLFRQLTYTTARLGMFGILKDALSPDGAPLPFFKKAVAGMTAGGFGAVIGTPAEVALVRMTADGRLPEKQRRGYRHVGDALGRVVREEGVATLWRGTLPTVGRAMVLNVAQLATYEQVKESVADMGIVGVKGHIVGSTVAGFVATAVSIPLDSAKTRVQNMKTVNGVPEYTGMVDALVKTVRKEGVLSLWKGFTPYFLRLGPHTILTFLALEQMKAAYHRRVG